MLWRHRLQGFSLSQVCYGGWAVASCRTEARLSLCRRFGLKPLPLRRTGGYNYGTYLPASPLLTMLSSLKRFPSQSKVLCPERSLLPTFPYSVGIKRAMRRRTRGLPSPLSGATVASLLAPSSAFPLQSRSCAHHGAPSAQATHPTGLPRLSSQLHSFVGWKVSARACASLV